MHEVPSYGKTKHAWISIARNAFKKRKLARKRRAIRDCTRPELVVIFGAICSAWFRQAAIRDYQIHLFIPNNVRPLIFGFFCSFISTDAATTLKSSRSQK
jgi:hypothetical protein